MSGILFTMSKATGFSKFRGKLFAFAEIERQIRRGRACTRASLARDLKVDPRTIGRYIEFMRKGLNAPIEFDPIDQTYVFTASSWTMPNVHLSDAELTTLAVGARSLAGVMPGPFAKRLEGLLSKLLEALPEMHRDEICRLKEQIDIVPSAVVSKGSEWVEPLMNAMREKCSVEIIYYVLSKQTIGRRIVDPYHMRFFAGAWYLVGFDHQTKYFPIFNLSRIRSLASTEVSFRKKPFSASKYFQDSTGVTVGGQARVIRLLLSGRVAATANERVWPGGFKYQPREGGTGTLEGRVSNVDDLLAWVASVGGDAVIIR